MADAVRMLFEWAVSAVAETSAEQVKESDKSSPLGGRYFKYSGAFVGDVHSLLTKVRPLRAYPTRPASRAHVFMSRKEKGAERGTRVWATGE